MWYLESQSVPNGCRSEDSQPWHQSAVDRLSAALGCVQSRCCQTDLHRQMFIMHCTSQSIGWHGSCNITPEITVPPREITLEVNPHGSVRVIPHGSGVRVSANFQMFALRMLLHLGNPQGGRFSLGGLCPCISGSVMVEKQTLAYIASDQLPTRL